MCLMCILSVLVVQLVSLLMPRQSSVLIMIVGDCVVRKVCIYIELVEYWARLEPAS